MINAKFLHSIRLPTRLLSTCILRGRFNKRLKSIHNIQIFLEFSSQKGRGWERKLSYWLPINTFPVILSPSLVIAFVGLLYVFNRCMTWVPWAHSGVVATPSSSRNPTSKWCKCKDAQSAVLAASMISTSQVWLFDASAVAVLSLLPRSDLWEIIPPLQPTLQLGFNSDVYLVAFINNSKSCKLYLC